MSKYIQEYILEHAKEKWFEGHYSPLQVVKTNTPYIMSYGGRNLGKTFAWLILIYAIWQCEGYKSVLMRRMAETLKSSKVAETFTKVFDLGYVPNNKGYTGITYRTGAWRGYWTDEKGKTTYDEAFCYPFALSSKIETNKGVSDIEKLGIIFFDEALTADNYLTDEWGRFQNAVSTLVRENSQACCVLCANTVSWVAPYFREFGIKNVRSIKKGTVKIFQCLDETAVTLEYCNDVVSNRKKKIVDRRFFGFKSGTADMIRVGGWEMQSYQHLTREMVDGKDKEIISRDIYLTYGDEIVCFELMRLEEYGLIINVRPADNYDLGQIIYGTMDHTDSRFRYSPQATSGIDKVIWGLYKRHHFYYVDNLCGETVKKYLQEIGMI